MSDQFYVEFYDGRGDQPCATEADAHRLLGMSRGAIWWTPDGLSGSRTCRRDTNDSQEERDRRDTAWRQAFLSRA
jgi:hypothetical protein